MRASSTVRVGLFHLGALEQNRALLEAGTIRAAEMGADWVISGELVVSGYRFEPLIGTDWISPQPDDWMTRFAELTGSLDVVNFISHPERDEAMRLQRRPHHQVPCC